MIESPAHLRGLLLGSVVYGGSGDGYRIQEFLGEGGQGWVFRATADVTQPAGEPSAYVIKVLRPEAMSEDSQKRFRREAVVLRKLSMQADPCPYLVRFYDHAEVRFDVDGKRVVLPFTVLEYVPGTTLEAELALHRGRGLSLRRIRRFLEHTVTALEFAHAQGVIHRDLKPSNILLTESNGEEVAKVTDFGLAKIISGDMDRTAQVAGASIGYAPPEQYERGNRRVSVQTDVFSLAALTFEMITGLPAYPFNPGENPLIVLTRVLSDARPSIRRGKGHVSADMAGNHAIIEQVDAVLQRALNPEPGPRHGTVREFLSALEACWKPLDQMQQPRLDPLRSPQLGRGSVPPPPITSTATLPAPAAPGTPVVASPEATRQPSAPAPSVPEPRSDARYGAAAAAAPNDPRWKLVATYPGRFHAALYASDGARILALSQGGLVALTRKSIVNVGAPLPCPAEQIRGIRQQEDDVLFFGHGGFVASASHTLRDFEVVSGVPSEANFESALVEEDCVTLVGESSKDGVACIVQIISNKIRWAVREPKAAGLLAVAPWRNGELLACGKHGALVSVKGQKTRSHGPIADVDLHALVVDRDDDSAMVGSGGHAFRLHPDLNVSLERVGTQKTLLRLARSPLGDLWAFAEDGRVLQHRSVGWPQLRHALPVRGAPLATWLGEGGEVHVFYSDGSLLEYLPG